MPTLRRRAASRPVEDVDIDVDETKTRAVEPVASNLETLAIAPDGQLEALGVVKDATEVTTKEEITEQISERDRDHQHPRRQRSHLPTALQFPLVAVLSFSISSLCYSFLSEWSRGELAGISKSLDTWGEVATLAGWRIPATAISALGIEMLSTFVPFQLLRPLSGAHAGAKNVANRELLSDVSITIFTTVLAAATYSATLFVSYKTYLPTALVMYFKGLPTLEPAYGSNFVATLPVTLAFGIAAKTYIFTPFVATGKTTEDGKLEEFDPATATLGETLAWNLWGYTTRAKVVIFRTTVAMILTGVNTYLQTFMTVNGVESYGAALYAGAWVAAAFLTGVGLGFVGGGEA
ncbi:hypothetical protein CBS470a_005882 [Colletotrichum nupharicola]|nr:hypothetical protein CBS470a_005882 [Colletotrichum nupharicola]